VTSLTAAVVRSYPIFFFFFCLLVLGVIGFWLFLVVLWGFFFFLFFFFFLVPSSFFLGSVFDRSTLIEPQLVLGCNFAFLPFSFV